MDDIKTSTSFKKEFPGGIEVHLALSELRKNYQQEHYLSVILLSHMIIERQLVGMLHRQGHRTNRDILTTYKKALQFGIIDDQEKRLLANLRLQRNAYLHYYEPEDFHSLRRRASIASKEPQEVLAQEAQILMDLSEALALR